MAAAAAAWDGMEEVVAVADAGSFVGAAKLLLVSTSHVSKTIARLEQRLATQLFDRTTRRVDLTDTGRAFVDQCRRIIHERDELMSMIGGSAEPQGELRVTCSVAMGERFIAPIVRRFGEAHPRLAIALDLTNRLVDLVGEGYDLAIRTGEIRDERLTGRPIATRPIETCAAPAYLHTHGAPASPADLTTHACLIGTSSAWHFREHGATRTYTPAGRWRCNNGVAVAEAAVAGMGICQLPAFYVRRHIEEGLLVPILTAQRAAPEPVFAVYSRRRHLMPKVRNLVDLLEQELAGESLQ